MRNNGILNIDVARADLPMQPEYWIEETYVSRYEKLLRVIEKKTSFLPYRNTKVIREISFEVPASTTLEQIKEVSLAFEKKIQGIMFSNQHRSLCAGSPPVVCLDRHGNRQGRQARCQHLEACHRYVSEKT